MWTNTCLFQLRHWWQTIEMTPTKFSSVKQWVRLEFATGTWARNYHQEHGQLVAGYATEESLPPGTVPLSILSLEQSRSHTLVNSPGTFSWLSSYTHFPTHEENLTGLILWAFQEDNPAVNKNNSDHGMPRGQNSIKTSILKQYPSLIHLFTHSLLTCFLAFRPQKSNIIFLENVEKVL